MSKAKKPKAKSKVFSVRTPLEVYVHLAMRAKAKKMSINRYVNLLAARGLSKSK